MYQSHPAAKMTKCYATIRNAEDALHRSFRGEVVPELSKQLLDIRNRFGDFACAAIQELALMSAEGAWGDYPQDASGSNGVAGAARGEQERLCAGGH
jgi:hypothetical protein